MDNVAKSESLSYLKRSRITLGLGLLLILAITCWFIYAIFTGYDNPCAYIGISVGAVGVGRIWIEWYELNKAINQLAHWEYLCGKRTERYY